MSGITEQINDDWVSLVYIVASNECASLLPRAAQRIRRNVRRTDIVLLSGHICAIVLPETPLQAAQAVARRVATLLVDVDCELQAFYGRSALTVWQRLQSDGAIEVSVKCRDTINRVQGDREEAREGEEARMEYSHAGGETNSVPEPSLQRIQSMPYLAFLADYPSRRLWHIFPYELACRYQCVPVGAERDMLTIGTSQRLDDAVIAHFEQVTKHGIFQVRCEACIIDDVLCYWQRVGVENIVHDGRTVVEAEGARQLI